MKWHSSFSMFRLFVVACFCLAACLSACGASAADTYVASITSSSGSSASANLPYPARVGIQCSEDAYVTMGTSGGVTVAPATALVVPKLAWYQTNTASPAHYLAVRPVSASTVVCNVFRLGDNTNNNAFSYFTSSGGGASPLRPPAVACGGDSFGAGFGSGVGHCEVLSTLLKGEALPWVAADYAVAGATVEYEYREEWAGLANPASPPVPPYGASREPYRFVVLGSPGTNDAVAGVTNSAAVIAYAEELVTECVASEATCLLATPHPIGDEAGIWTITVQYYLDYVNANLLAYCVDRARAGAPVYCENFAATMADISTLPNARHFSINNGGGTYTVLVNGTPITATWATSDDVTATTIANAINAASGPLTASATTNIVYLSNVSSGLVQVIALGQGIDYTGLGTGLGTCASSCTPTMPASYISATPGHANLAGATAEAHAFQLDIDAAVAAGR